MNGIERATLTPKQRLALSRRALVRQLHGGAEAGTEHYVSDSSLDDELEFETPDPSAELPLGETREGRA